MDLEKLPSNHKTYICKHVFNTDRPVAYVVVEDGDLSLLCGCYDHEESARDYKVVGLAHLIKRQPDILEIGELFDGWQAERLEDGCWHKSPIPEAAN
ncbi:hypothetical protein [Oricola sp.]|uniref:hypothetical protein n=1 Tax=Oricola sp. TaxID=1979950 RepID=UPI0025F90E43|nr:hypothetical protein [Oricola sp.]MCI5078317.1 hypothetical protein [Oricola sp.]